MVDLKKVFFGFSDAHTEADRNPQLFKEVFFDPHGYLAELIHGDRFLLCGRKGDGKSAYSAQINLTTTEHNIFAYQRSLNNFNNSTFLQIKRNEALGGNPYISFWKAILLIECVNMINLHQPNIQVTKFVDLVDALNQYGFFSKENDISFTVRKLVELNTNIEIHSFFRHGRKYQNDIRLRGADEIFNAIKDTICDIYLEEKFVLIIDGLDDILNNSEFKADIIMGLIRATESLNNTFRKTTLSIKCLLLIRNDILNLCRDPNLSKIIRDSAIRLSWNLSEDPFESDLLKLVSKRIDKVSGGENSLVLAWSEIFPSTICGKSSIDYILDNIIYRPRDILQFFLEVQKVFVNGQRLSEDNVQDALEAFSEEYFVDAMRDELTGFFPDAVVTALPDVLSKMGARLFYPKDFAKICEQYSAFSGVSPNQILEKLFQAGYIGQHRPREKNDYTVFSYRNPREKFQEDHECILHRGLMRALTI